MKTSHTLLFILSVFLMMGLIGYAIPTKGIKIADATITFPQFSELVEPSVPTIDSTQAFLNAQKMRLFISTQQASEEMQRRFAVIRHRYAISFPNDSIEWIYPFFAALDNTNEKPIRILHYGDSQIEIDRITSDLRQSFMNKWGGFGVGLVPAVQTIPTSAISQDCDAELTRYMVYGPAEMRSESSHYGVLGQTALIDGSATFSFRNIGMSKQCTKRFNTITILVDEIESALTISISLGDYKVTKTANTGDNRIVFALPAAVTQATVTVTGKGLIQAFLLDGDGSGIQYDNAAMRGCSGTIFTSINRSSLSSYFNYYQVPLIIMQFGGNVVPYLKTEKQITDYCLSIERQLRYLRQVSPHSKILFIGPSDMSTSIGGHMKTYPMLNSLVESLRQTCLTNDVAFWSLYHAMGGENSMAQWVKNTPAYAGSDYVHFTPAGATHTAEMLYEAIDVAYQYYQHRIEDDKTQIELQ